mmetsp:Transcript_9929/g.8459  ORF Transcript_9929/g.8459 Transcript_9929/m.8459 type:complete len:234 (+) Transcript_9929:255-956(+)
MDPKKSTVSDSMLMILTPVTILPSLAPSSPFTTLRMILKVSTSLIPFTMALTMVVTGTLSFPSSVTPRPTLPAPSLTSPLLKMAKNFMPPSSHTMDAHPSLWASSPLSCKITKSSSSLSSSSSVSLLPSSVSRCSTSPFSSSLLSLASSSVLSSSINSPHTAVLLGSCGFFSSPAWSSAALWDTLLLNSRRLASSLSASASVVLDSVSCTPPSSEVSSTSPRLSSTLLVSSAV